MSGFLLQKIKAIVERDGLKPTPRLHYNNLLAEIAAGTTGCTGRCIEPDSSTPRK